MGHREGENRTVLPFADDDARIIDDREWPEDDPYELQRQRDIDEEREMNHRADMEAAEAAFKNWLHRQGDLSAKSIHQAVRTAFFDGAQFGIELCKKINDEIIAEVKGDD